jgi:hypothetical protein
LRSGCVAFSIFLISEGFLPSGAVLSISLLNLRYVFDSFLKIEPGGYLGGDAYFVFFTSFAIVLAILTAPWITGEIFCVLIYLPFLSLSLVLTSSPSLSSSVAADGWGVIRGVMCVALDLNTGSFSIDTHEIDRGAFGCMPRDGLVEDRKIGLICSTSGALTTFSSTGMLLRGFIFSLQATSVRVVDWSLQCSYLEDLWALGPPAGPPIFVGRSRCK